MNASPSTLDAESRPGLFERLVSEFPAAVEEWSRSVNRLNRWEDEHLLVENPPPEKLAHHRKVIERLMFFGQLCALGASHPEFGDAETAGMVTATQEVLRHKLRMFHHPMPREKAEAILREVFAES